MCSQPVTETAIGDETWRGVGGRQEFQIIALSAGFFFSDRWQRPEAARFSLAPAQQPLDQQILPETMLRVDVLAMRDTLVPGSVTASTSRPFLASSCSAVSCPLCSTCCNVQLDALAMLVTQVQ